MGKKIIFLGLSLLFLLPEASSQRTPDFATTIYFEDARGNRDSVVIGYDAETPHYFHDPDFGEFSIPLDMPFDSVFEVRIPVTPQLGYSKTHIISSPECGRYSNFENIIEYYVKIIYPPLKVKWDRAAFSDFCHQRSIIQSHLQGPLLGLYSDAVYFNLQDSVVFTDEEMKEKNYSYDLKIDTTVRVMNTQFSPGKTATIELRFSQSFKLFPNPAQDHIQIQWQGWEPQHLFMYSMDGKLIGRQVLQPEEGKVLYAVRSYPPGIYICSLQDAEGNLYSARWVKVE